MSLFVIDRDRGAYMFINPHQVRLIRKTIHMATVVTEIEDTGGFTYRTCESLETVVNRYQSAIGSSRTYANMISKLEKESK